jgi:methionyl-tRNA formyltransferase
MLAKSKGKSLRLIFLGTPGFAQPSLRALSEADLRPLAVVTRPDKPQGRGLRLEPPPIALLSRELGIEVLQPVSPRQEGFFEKLKSLVPDLMVVVAYGHILRKDLLDLPSMGCVNLHASLLPKYRGAAPIPWAIIKGEKATGVTTIAMNEKMDEGDILLQKEVGIGEDETAGELGERLARVGAKLLVETIRLMEEGKAKRTPQDSSQASYAPKLSPEIQWIDWARPAREIVNLVRGLAPEPGATTRFREASLKVLKASSFPEEASFKVPGTIQELRKGKGPLVSTDSGAVLLERIQMEGRREMDGGAFLNGYRILPGESFG